LLKRPENVWLVAGTAIDPPKGLLATVVYNPIYTVIPALRGIELHVSRLSIPSCISALTAFASFTQHKAQKMKNNAMGLSTTVLVI